MKRPRQISAAMIVVALPVVCLSIASTLRAAPDFASAKNRTGSAADGLSAFRDIAAVLVSPRCLNCHVTGQSPLQGDDGRPHNMNVKRAADGRGTPAMKCTNCHQSTNSEFPHAPPGAPDWRLPGVKTPMAWQGLSTGELCRAIQDRSKNGGRSLSSLLEHVKSDRIVNWAWNPGIGRTTPPITHQQFVDKFSDWLNSGAPCQP